MERPEMLERLKNGDDPLDVSIDKWRDMVKNPTDKCGSASCALCEMYHKKSCIGCPANPQPQEIISERDCCDGSYYKYADATYDDATKKNLRPLARAVRDYLKSLKKKRSKQ